MKPFYHGKNKTSGESSNRANYALSHGVTGGVPLIGWEGESPGTPQQPRGISYREGKKGKDIPPSIASKRDNKTGSSLSWWNSFPSELNTQRKKSIHMNDNHIVEVGKTYTSINTTTNRSNYAYRADARTNTEANSTGICLVKRLNGKIEQIDMRDIQTAFPNYIPYERNENNTLLSSVFNSADDTEKSKGKVGDISNLPVVYQNVELDLDLVKKCRQASTSRKAFSQMRQRSVKHSAKIKLPIGIPPLGQTALGSHRKTLLPPRSFSCNNTIYNPSDCRQSSVLRSTSQKRTFSNVQTWYSAPGGESNFPSCGKCPIKRFPSAQHPEHASTMSLCSPEVVPPKKDATPQTSLLKRYATPMLLKHSTNMILSQLKKMKGSHGIHEKGTCMKLENKEKQKEVQFEPSSFSKKHMDHQPAVDGKIDKVDYPRCNSSSVKNYHQVDVRSNPCNISTGGYRGGDLTLQKLLAKKTKVKSIEEEKYIEKVNSYKVIYQSDDFVSIYQNGGDKIIKDHCIDMSSLLCIPGYVGGYLCESNSTVHHSHANGKENPQEKDIERSGSIVSARSFTTHAQQEQGKLWIDPDVDLLNDNLILYHLRKAIDSSLTLNVDLQYLVLLNEKLKNRKSVGESLRGLRGEPFPIVV
ncbi:conserved Plasmodium protein, unknown function [Plasmodium knowlesi strain H]|uniref:Uncharacterized protein n=3 Tax=Plasmodium knowlesi TaxID=5850 RepID=A0A5E7X158_PLAKH|nr:conserved Plasmodium protein, unknown function [Plasmodium knowlesi strain H]OTN65162.1 Uncharacterized protein PKNOH_S120161600 [Plasmodium knowlesi]CAA9988472.1 conserved Plasmodium protein, unknown function [Plasmodium knowlesi strain H]SBO19768.1 conserved Plasmodium protein, unknown function [Plasmodium knowlesi strain H]SBO20472.1 conserved Plasmodium protein, unknown function [Plasmodium knowlesi strain H]VVS77946.1 conserved Plasmodium protein, unknown function [Plasmodium knowlesi 